MEQMGIGGSKLIGRDIKVPVVFCKLFTANSGVLSPYKEDGNKNLSSVVMETKWDIIGDL